MKFRLDGQMYDFDESTISIKEAMQIKVATGLDIPELMDGLGSGNPFAFASMVWLAKLRDGETGPDGKPLKFDDLDFNILDFEPEQAEPPVPTGGVEKTPDEPPNTLPSSSTA